MTEPRPEDGKPLFFDVKDGDIVQCVYCLKNGNTLQYPMREGFISDYGSLPEIGPDAYTICKGHLPDNAVIFNPWSKMCRNKAGDETWSGED